MERLTVVRGFMARMKRSDPRMDTCGTPEETLAGVAIKDNLLGSYRKVAFKPGI